MKNTNTTLRRVAIAATALMSFGMLATACGEDVVDDDVEDEINEIDNSIEDFVDTVFTDDTSTDSTGG